MDCQYESSVVDGKKSYCELMGCWTNCREVEECVYERFYKPKQLALFENTTDTKE